MRGALAWQIARERRTGDQHHAYYIAAWLSRTDRNGSLAGFRKPDLTPPERTVAQVEGWILGLYGVFGFVLPKNIRPLR